MRKIKDTKTIKIYIEVPEKWFDGDMSNDLDFITRTCRREIQNRLMDIAVDKLLKSIKVPDIQIDQEELKKIILDKMAEAKLNSRDM